MVLAQSGPRGRHGHASDERELPGAQADVARPDAFNAGLPPPSIRSARCRARPTSSMPGASTPDRPTGKLIAWSSSLDRWARDRAVRAEHAAVTLLRPE